MTTNPSLEFTDKRIPSNFAGQRAPGFAPAVVVQCTYCSHQTFYLVPNEVAGYTITCANCGKTP